MKKYNAAPGCETIGQGILIFFENMEKDAIRPFLEAAMRKHGIQEIKVDAWYPVQFTLDLLRALEESESGMFNQVAVGMAIMGSFPYSPEVKTIPDAVNGVSVLYTQAIRNYDPSEGYDIRQIDANHLRVTDNTPWPHDLLYGYFYSIAQRFCPKGMQFKLQRTYLNPQEPNQAGAVYDITWGTGV
jgi:hypothetical protein